MKFYRPTVETIEVSDLSVKIACKLYDAHLLSETYMSISPYEDMTPEEKNALLVEEASIVIDKTIKKMS